MRIKSSARSSGERAAASRLERKTVEKMRRMHMKSLCMKLSSLIPKQHCTNSKDILTQQDHLDLAATYIQSMKERIERLKRRKEKAKNTRGINETESCGMVINIEKPVIEVRQMDSDMEVVLISGLEKRFMFHEVIGVLEEEGARVVNASFSIVGNKIFHTIHSQAFSPRIGLEASTVSERLKQLVC